MRLATSDAFANELVPRLCVEFQRTYAGVQFSVIALPAAQVPDAVRSGAADICLCFSRAPHKAIDEAYRQSAPPAGPAAARPPAGQRRQPAQAA